jgi:23S rRNA (adenine-N6)-dimethyltransferase
MSRMASRVARYSVSQNFLTSGALIRRLIRRAGIQNNDDVIEIGAGKGHITRALAAACRSVRAYEIDPKLIARLQASFDGASNVAIVGGDFLHAKLPARGAYKVFSNIPFSITTAIIKKLTRAMNPPAEAWLVMERGAAMRLMGLPRESQLSLSVKPYFSLSIAHRFARADFHPMPAVDAVLVRMTRRAQPDIAPCERGAYAAFIEKSLSRGLKHALTAPQIRAALRAEGLGESGEMRYVQWLCLFRCHRRLGG